MSSIVVRHEEGDRFAIDVAGHTVIVDQPVEAGGGDAGPTPTELFVGSLASCVAFYAGRFLRRHGLSTQGLSVECDFAMSTDRPARVVTIDVRLVVPAGVPSERLPAMQRVVEHCTVHNSIHTAPAVQIEIDARARVA